MEVQIPAFVSSPIRKKTATVGLPPLLILSPVHELKSFGRGDKLSKQSQLSSSSSSFSSSQPSSISSDSDVDYEGKQCDPGVISMYSSSKEELHQVTCILTHTCIHT